MAGIRARRACHCWLRRSRGGERVLEFVERRLDERRIRGPSERLGVGPGPGKTADPNKYTLGLLTDLSGLAASAEKTTPLGVKAGVGLANANGYQIKYVVADATIHAERRPSAAHKLVEQDHVTAVIAISGLTFAASSYLTAKGVPVIGAATDGPEWITSRNMFSSSASRTSTPCRATTGDFLKLVGAQNLAAVGYSVPQSSNAGGEERRPRRRSMPGSRSAI